MAGENKQEAHRPGALKQANKVHKTGRHRSKGSISVTNKGKIAVKSITKRNKHELNREARRNQANQIRKNKRDEVLLKKRSIGGVDCAPFLITLLPLNCETKIDSVVDLLKKCDEESVIQESPNGITHICVPRFKQRFSFIVPRIGDHFSILDCLKVSDFVVFLISSTATDEDGIIDDFGQDLLMTSFAQGLPTPIVAVTDVENIPQKKRNDHRNLVQKSITKWFPELKLVTLENSGDYINLLRKIGSSKKKPVIYRDRRPHLIAEKFEFSPNTSGINPGVLKISGYLRGSPLSVNNLIHIPGLGDFQMNQIESSKDPYSFDRKRKTNCMDSDNDHIEILQSADDAKQESLDAENIPDLMDAEQTWPTEEELQEAAKTEKQIKRKKAPPGWSEYQSAWIPDDDTEFYNDLSDDDSDKSEYMDAQSEEKSDDDDDVGDYNYEDATTQSEIAVNDDRYDEEFDLFKERDELEKIRAARVDKMFPDEIDTPLDQPARTRFQKYRGMESFRTSPWDPNENLPQDYARIYRFENFDRARKKIVRDQEDLLDEEGVKVGKYITIHVKDVPQSSWENFVELKQQLIVFGLYPFEHKMSVVNVVLKRTPNYLAAIKSKERLIFQCGYRRFETNPLFSQHTTGTRHKFERFFQPESTAVATFFGRIQFPPAPVLCYKQEHNKLILVATGSLLSCNPDRIILKRVALSGHPLKIYKHSAVVRFMFFNRDDINYFKSIKLKTKMGRIGHIKEPLGTHGHIKCIFDGQLKSQDTVLMNLYKRVFPKWTYEDYVKIAAQDADMDI